RQALDRNWLTNDGPLVHELEGRFAEFQGVSHAVAVSSATAGLQLVARALELTGEVIMPAFTFIGTAQAMSWVGLQPVFCDVSPETHTLDPSCVADAITPDTAAILGVHVWGQACDIDGLRPIAEAHGLPLMFDAAPATGSAYRSVRVGGFGRAEVFSLHATKAVNGLEGGIVATDDSGLADRLRRIRNYGFVAEDTVSILGTNAKMNEFCAAMALANLARYERLHEHDDAIHEAYRTGLDGLPGITLAECRAGDSRCHHYAVIEVSDGAPIRREALRAVLAAEQVTARRYFKPGCHRSPPYSAHEPRHPLPVTERLSRSLLQLPTGVQLRVEDALRIAAIVTMACEEHRRVELALAQQGVA
ncbi:MAG: DegT/DnrJ/EryC1/StrS family aminotransferase, partial [Acidobacteria bacterium]|nr:DegT/DnrJ/EryC1/StrS family aminotransferase [Acidobacteriota bacterium]